MKMRRREVATVGRSDDDAGAADARTVVIRPGRRMCGSVGMVAIGTTRRRQHETKQLSKAEGIRPGLALEVEVQMFCYGYRGFGVGEGRGGAPQLRLGQAWRVWHDLDVEIGLSEVGVCGLSRQRFGWVRPALRSGVVFRRRDGLVKRCRQWVLEQDTRRGGLFPGREGSLAGGGGGGGRWWWWMVEDVLGW